MLLILVFGSRQILNLGLSYVWLKGTISYSSLKTHIIYVLSILLYNLYVWSAFLKSPSLCSTESLFNNNKKAGLFIIPTNSHEYAFILNMHMNTQAYLLWKL